MRRKRFRATLCFMVLFPACGLMADSASRKPTAKADGLRVENGAVSLSWAEGVLEVLNRRSGMRHRFDFPAFALGLKGSEIAADQFRLTKATASKTEATFIYRHDQLGLEARVSYRLEGEKPWFRKTVSLAGPKTLPTLDRLWVDLQTEPPTPVRRVGYGLRGGAREVEAKGRETYAEQPGCGFPVWAGDWFVGLEHPAAFAVPGERLELYHHPTWDEAGKIESISAVFGAAVSAGKVAEAFMDYVWHVRRPRLEKPFVTITVGWSTMSVGGGEYIDSLEANEAFLAAMLELGLKPDGFALDAGYFDRRSLFRHKADDDEDSRLAAFAQKVRSHGMDLSLWVSHNGRTGFDMEWIRSQGWKTGSGPGSYRGGEFVVMMQPSFEEALGKRFEQLADRVGVRHLKIDWDNECATAGPFAERYPTPDHVREASIRVFNRIDSRMRARNTRLLTRDGWWPSPWWLCWADHTWLTDSGDCEYASWPSRTQRDREITHRDASYHQVFNRAETPYPLDAIDNHGFADALANPFSDEPHTWIDNAVLNFTRGSTYMHFPLCPEDLRSWQAETLQQVLEWMRAHANELGARDTRFVGGNPALGEVYGFLHPGRETAWMAVRNPSPEPRGVAWPVANWLGWAPRTIRQVYPFWEDSSPLSGISLLGHEVRLFRLLREQEADPSPVPGAPFMVRKKGESYEYLFPGNRALSREIRPSVHETMQIPEVSAEKTFDGPIKGGRRMQWYAAIPHRFEKAELYVKLSAPQETLDGLTVKAYSSRYRGVATRPSHTIAAERIFRNEERGYGTRRWLPPLGPRDRDDYVFRIPDGGWISLTLDLLGKDPAAVQIEAWITGYESPARKTVVQTTGPTNGPLLPIHPYGFARWLKL